MKYLLLLVGTTLSFSCSQTPGEPAALTFLVAGQSNSVSRVRIGEQAFSSSGLVSVSEMNSLTGDFDDLLVTPTEDNPTTASLCWLTTGDLLNRPSTFVNVSVGGTKVSQWRTEYFQRIRHALAERTFDAVLWGQGESDYEQGTSEQEYYDDLRWVIENSREIQPGLRWVVALNSEVASDNPIRRAQSRLIADGIAERGPDADQIPRLDESRQHFIGEDIALHGRRWFEALVALGFGQ